MTKFCMFFGVEIVFGDTQRCSSIIHELHFIMSFFKPKEIPHINHIQNDNAIIISNLYNDCI